ncbi:hypothetical protein FS837_005798 [Tulasnella sp. UAMH 9824]|nr:hypothetical protein FS837_005798 [Tulasnella sp. UAMH 9824]
MVSTRSQKGQSTSNNAANRKVSAPAKLATKSNKRDRHPPRKRVRVASSDVEAVKHPVAGDSPTEPGLRELLLSLPVELFGEICSFLDAIELRSLSLADQTFWSILASEKSDPIWRQAFKRVVPPMPACPETMSGSDYAQLMLVQACMVSALEVISRQSPSALTDHIHDKICQVNGWGVNLDYFHRVRYCGTCHRRNIISENAVLSSFQDFPPDFLKYLSSKAVSPDGSSVADFHQASYGSKRQYLKVTVAEVYKLWKSMSQTSDTPELAKAQLIERLEKYRETRIKSGLKMKVWQVTAAEWNTAEARRVLKERKALILLKLLELGFEEADFPRYCPEVNLTKALDDEEWEQIRPSVVSAAESSKISRLSTEIWRRRNNRSQALQVLWHGVVGIASGTRAVYTAEKNACPDFREFIAFAPAEALLEVDTDGIPAQEINAIRPDSLQFVIQGRRRYLVKLRNVLDGLPLDQTDEEEWSSLSNDETIAKLDTIAARLAKAVNGFWDSKQKHVDWYPSYYLASPRVDLSVLSPVEDLAPGLIAKVLEIIEKGPDTEAGAVAGSSWRRKMVGYRCARCDESAAPYLTFKEMISHFLEKKVWFDKASEAREKAFAESPGSKDPRFHSILFNDHDWNSEESIMVSDDSHEKARVRKLQNQLEAAYGNDPEDYNGEDFTTRSRRSAKQAPQLRKRRICRLCPEGYSPKPMYFATLKIHIEHIHCKAVNVEEDTAAFDPGRDVAPANPCTFDTPFARLYY